MIDYDNLTVEGFWDNQPYPHAIVDNFWNPDVAQNILAEVKDVEYNAAYTNPFELKNACNIWDRFSPTVYQAFTFLSSRKFTDYLGKILDIPDLIPDVGLHGGGIHYHPPGGKLNPHVDYSHHPKLGYRRKLNFLVYLNPGWQTDHGGELGMWTPEGAQTFKEPVKTIEPLFNRAVVFESTQTSYHGLARPTQQPRRSMAFYYLVDDQTETTSPKAAFVPTKEQKDDPEVYRLAELRKTQRL